MRRTIDPQGKSRAWINGSPATVTQLREAAEHLVDIHGQHAWQSLTRPAAVRALLDAQAGIDTARWLPVAHLARGRAALDAGAQQREIERERERLAVADRRTRQAGPGDGEWDELNAEHQRLAHAQALIDAARPRSTRSQRRRPGAER
jgi:DNA repair protein RecN (Recombination protein N)